GDGALPRLGLSRSATRSRPLDRGAWAAARRRCRSTRRRGRSALGAAGASARGVEAATAIVAARAVVAPEGAVVVTTRPLAAARPVVRADAQLAPADLRAADALHLLRAEGAADLHQGEVGEDLDLPDVLAVQAALAGDGADDARRPRTVRVAHTHLVRGVAALRRGSLARAAIAIAARGAVLAQLRAGELLLLGRGAGALITHGHRAQGGRELERIDVVLGHELSDQLAVQLETTALDTGGDLGQLSGQAMLGDVARGGDDRLGGSLLGGALDVRQGAALVRADEGHCLPGASGAAGAADAVDVGLRFLRHIEVDDQADALHVEAAGGDVGGDEHLQRAVAETLDDLLALLLGHVAADRRGDQASAHQCGADLLGGRAGAHEHDRRLRIGGGEHAGQGPG